MLVLGYFLLTVLSVGGEDERREVKMFEDIESQDIRDNFDSFPLLRRDVKDSSRTRNIRCRPRMFGKFTQRNYFSSV